MRQEEKIKKDQDPQEEEDAPASSPLKEESLGLISNSKQPRTTFQMTSQLRLWMRGVFFCLLASLLFTQEAPALDKKISFALSHYIMAVYYDRRGLLDQAVGEYKKVLKFEDENPVVHLNLAATFIKGNQLDNAIKELKLASQLDPEAVEPHAILALVYYSKGQSELATKEYEIALKSASKLQPKNIDIYRSLALIYLQQKKLKEAENTYRLILGLSPNDATAYFYLANIYDELKDRAKAEKELRKALELKPDYHEALNYLGYLLVEENRNLGEAEELIKKALVIQPNNGAYLDSMGWLYFKKGDSSAALKYLEKAITLVKDPVIYEHLGDVFLKSGENQKAKENWQKALEMNPNLAQVAEKLKGLTKVE